MPPKNLPTNIVGNVANYYKIHENIPIKSAK